MKKMLLILFFCTMAISLNSCLHTADVPNEGSEGADALFNDVREILRMNCTPCHSYNEQSAEELIAAGLIAEGNALNSPLYYRLRNSKGPKGPKNMPTDGPIGAIDIQTVEAWIDSL